jgi:hypothetical protein
MDGNQVLAGLHVSTHRIKENSRLNFRRGVVADRLLIIYRINRKGCKRSRPGTMIAMLSNTTKANQAGISRTTESGTHCKMQHHHQRIEQAVDLQSDLELRIQEQR